MRLTLILITTLFFSFYAAAQEPIKVKEITNNMTKGEQPGMETRIPQADLKTVIKNWEKAVRNDTKNKMEDEGDEYYVYQTLVERISSTPINVFAKIWDTKEGVFIMAFFEADTGKFVSSTTEETKFESAQVFLYDFAVANYKEAVGEELKQEQKILKDLEKDLDKLHSDHDGYVKSIDKSEQSIRQSKDKIKENARNQERQLNLVHDKKDQLTGITDEDAKKNAEKEMKTLEKGLEKLRKEDDKLHKSISDSEADIRDAKRQIEVNLKDQELKEGSIGEQKELVLSVEEKLANIK